MVVTVRGAQACESVLSHFLQWQKQKRLLAALMFQANWGWGSAALAILFSLILCGGLAAAQQRDPQDGSTLSIEDLMKIKVPTVCGASKFEQKIIEIEAPSFITIITSDEIRKHGYRTFAEVLRRVPGFFVTDDRNYGYVATRGMGRIVQRPHADSDRWTPLERERLRRGLCRHGVSCGPRFNELRCSRGKKFSLDRSVGRAYYFALGLD